MRRHSSFLSAGAGAAVLSLALGPCEPGDDVTPPPVNAGFDYQIGGDYRPPSGVRVVSRDWFAGSALTGSNMYSICYVNPFQTQDDERGVNRRDERSNWPQDLVHRDR